MKIASPRQEEVVDDWELSLTTLCRHRYNSEFRKISWFSLDEGVTIFGRGPRPAWEFPTNSGRIPKH